MPSSEIYIILTLVSMFSSRSKSRRRSSSSTVSGLEVLDDVGTLLAGTASVVTAGVGLLTSTSLSRCVNKDTSSLDTSGFSVDSGSAA